MYVCVCLLSAPQRLNGSHVRFSIITRAGGHRGLYLTLPKGPAALTLVFVLNIVAYQLSM